MEWRSSNLPPLIWNKLLALFLEKNVPRTLRDQKKYELTTLV